MGTPIRLPTPVLTVIMADGAVHTVQTLNVDMLRWDRDRAKHKWPGGDEAPFVWMTYLAWCALRREGVIEDMSLAVFEERCHGVRSDIGTDDAADPTSPAPGGG
jgi:hypothetical protein